VRTKASNTDAGSASTSSKLLSAHLTPAPATDQGLKITGDPAVLRRLTPAG
jgi:hypothetical protein